MEKSQFIPASKEPTKEQIKKLIGIAISVGSDVSMENHVYSIDGEVRRQLKGGAIGSVLTGDNSRLCMMNWDRKYRSKLKKLEITLKLYMIYVDDPVIVTKMINKGWKYHSHKNILIYSKEKYE